MAGKRARGQARGFTLIEVLVAFVILALSLGAVLPALSGSLSATRAGNDLIVATAYAQSLIAGVGVEGRLAEGEFVNTLERPGFASVLRVRPLGATEGATDGPRLFEVIARVSWQDGAREQAVTLRTQRFARGER